MSGTVPWSRVSEWKGENKYHATVPLFLVLSVAKMWPTVSFLSPWLPHHDGLNSQTANQNKPSLVSWLLSCRQQQEQLQIQLLRWQPWLTGRLSQPDTGLGQLGKTQEGSEVRLCGDAVCSCWFMARVVGEENIFPRNCDISQENDYNVKNSTKC